MRSVRWRHALPSGRVCGRVLLRLAWREHHRIPNMYCRVGGGLGRLLREYEINQTVGIEIGDRDLSGANRKAEVDAKHPWRLRVCGCCAASAAIGGGRCCCRHAILAIRRLTQPDEQLALDSLAGGVRRRVQWQSDDEKVGAAVTIQVDVRV